MIDTNLRHVDVAILYGQGQKDRAQYIAKRLYKRAVLPAWNDRVSNGTTRNDDMSLSGSSKTTCPECGKRMPLVTWTGEKPKCSKCAGATVIDA